jgi:amino acid transporter
VSFDSPFFALLVLAFVSILVIGLLEVLPDRRLAILAVVTMAVACGIAYCTVIIKA